MTEAGWLAGMDPITMLLFLTDGSAPVRMHCPVGSHRKLRLFAVACCRIFNGPCMTASQHDALETAERYADGEVSDAVRIRAFEKAERTVGWPSWPESPSRAAAIALRNTLLGPGELARQLPHDLVRVAESQSKPTELLAQWADLLRDIVGNPFRPTNLAWKVDPARGGPPRLYRLIRTEQRKRPNPHTYEEWEKVEWLAWNDGTVSRLAEAAYRERLGDSALDTQRLAILCDALQEVGCTDEPLLLHLRGWEFVDDRTWATQPLRGPHARGCWALDTLLGKD